MRVMREGELFTLKIKDVTFKLKPLDYAERMSMVQHDLIRQGKLVEESNFRILEVLRCSIKEIDGVYYSDGEPFELEFDGDKISAKCISALMQAEYNHELVLAAQHISANTHWTMDIPGIKFEYPGSDKKKVAKSKASKSKAKK